ncbi:MAG: hypothetical protein Greene101449_1110 [Candidatus Peregrinibacteria bacterium Greene1014_49]|nr:MAG: hypothetical protein Greene101449_1110 [Candidatus Peregrinibacteria bacterium Greene1014_49]
MSIHVASGTRFEEGYHHWFRHQPESQKIPELGSRRYVFGEYLSQIEQQVRDACRKSIVTLGTLSLGPDGGHKVIITTQGECAEHASDIIDSRTDVAAFERGEYLQYVHTRLQMKCPEAILQAVPTDHSGTIVLTDPVHHEHVKHYVEEREHLQSIGRVIPMGRMHYRQILDARGIPIENRTISLASPSPLA